MLKFVPVTNGKLYSQGHTCGDIACDNIVSFSPVNRLIFLSTDESSKCFNTNVLVGLCDMVACGGRVSCLIWISLYQILCHRRYLRTFLKLDVVVVSTEQRPRLRPTCGCDLRQSSVPHASLQYLFVSAWFPKPD